ncbi:MAG: hypothetical protein WBB50_12735, partial [Methyloceanibacter sp.]
IERAQGATGADLGAAEEPAAEPGLDESEAGASEAAAPAGERKARSKGGRNEAKSAGNGKAKPEQTPTSEPSEPEAKAETPELVEDNG